MSSILKFLTDLPCQVYCDYEFKGEVLVGSILKIEVKKGSYLLEFISIQNKLDKVIKEITVQSNDEEKLFRISFKDISEEKVKNKIEFDQIASLPVELVFTMKGYLLHNVETDSYIELDKSYLFKDAEEYFDVNGLLSVNIGGEFPNLPWTYTLVGGKFGCVNKLGQIIIPIIYDEPVTFTNKDVAVARIDLNSYFINNFGDIAFDNLYNEVHDFVNDICIIEKDNLFGVINCKGDILIPIVYEGILIKEDDTLWACLNSKWGIIDRQNVVLKPFYFDEISTSWDKNIGVFKDGLWGICDSTGCIIIPIKYEIIYYDEYTNYSSVRTNGKIGVINVNFKRDYNEFSKFQEIIPCVYDAVFNQYGESIKREKDFHYPFSHYFVIFEKTEIIHCFRYNEKGDLLYDFICNSIFKDSIKLDGKEGRLRYFGEITKYEKYDFLNNIVKIPCIYDEIKNVYNGKSYLAKLNEKWGILSILGEIIIPFIYDQLFEVENCKNPKSYIIHAKLNDKWGVYTTSGVEIIPILFTEITESTEEFAVGIINNKYSIFKNGKTRQFNYEFVTSIADFWAVKFKSKWAICDNDFNLITAFEYDEVKYKAEFAIVETMILVDERKLYGVFDPRKGEVIQPCKYLEKYYIRTKTSVATYFDFVSRKEGVLDEASIKILILPKFEYIRPFLGIRTTFFVIGILGSYFDGEYIGGKFAVMNSKGQMITEPIFDGISSEASHPDQWATFTVDEYYGSFHFYSQDINYIIPFLNFHSYSNSKPATFVTNPFDNISLFIDLETTGLPLNNNVSFVIANGWPYIVKIALILFDNDRETILSKRDIIIKPEGYVIPVESIKIHNISQDYAIRYGESRRDVIQYLDLLLNNVQSIVGHNIRFDLEILKYEIIRVKGKQNALFMNKNLNVVDTMDLGKEVCKISDFDNGYKSPTLEELYNQLFLKSLNGTHSAINDVQATFDCYFELKKRGVIQEQQKEISDGLPF